MSSQITTFRLGKTLLGLDILLIKEVYRNISLTPIPDSPDHLRGLMNLRGKVVTVIDLSICLNRPPLQNVNHGRLLILKTDDELMVYQNKGLLTHISVGEDIVGFLIDRMDDVLEVEASDILPPPANMENTEEGLVEGIIKNGEDLVVLLNVSAVLNKVIAAVEQG